MKLGNEFWDRWSEPKKCPICGAQGKFGIDNDPYLLNRKRDDEGPWDFFAVICECGYTFFVHSATVFSTMDPSEMPL